MRGYDTRYFPPSIPLGAKGGIRATSRRGSFGRSWWAKRWIAVLESFQIGARLARGRSYARQGQVLSIAIEKGIVKAEVQGARREPYHVTIKVKTLSPVHWKKLAIEFSKQAIFAAKLLAGEMPQEIETAFESLDFSLFPEGVRDLLTDCSCPDWSNPCKHTAAVYYLLGEEFDRDPFLIFKMRGMTRGELIGLLDHVRNEMARSGSQPRARGTVPDPEVARASEPLSANGARFWVAGGLPADICGEARVPAVTAALVKRLGQFPFWQGSVALGETLELIYDKASERGTRLFVGEWKF